MLRLSFTIVLSLVTYFEKFEDIIISLFDASLPPYSVRHFSLIKIPFNKTPSYASLEILKKCLKLSSLFSFQVALFLLIWRITFYVRLMVKLDFLYYCC